MTKHPFSKPALEKPILRGHMHQAAFFAALGAGAMLIAESPTAMLGSIWIYVLSLWILYASSAVYHRPNWKPEARSWFKRLDHCAIYFLIAGSTTPLAVAALEGNSQRTLLLLMWGFAALGCLQSLFWIKAPKAICAAIYLLMGSLALPYLSEIRQALDTQTTDLLAGGGIAYVVGAIVYASKWPNPKPKHFGYHEIFHLFVILGSLFHFLMIRHGMIFLSHRQ